jgi:hypothetical protein
MLPQRASAHVPRTDLGVPDQNQKQAAPVRARGEKVFGQLVFALSTSAVDDWNSVGFGILSHSRAMQLLPVGDIRRFPTSHYLVGDAGLSASVHSPEQERHGGGIAKQGRRDIRKTMVAVAWVAVANHHCWKSVFERLADRVGKQKAIGAIARKMLVLVWHVIAKRFADREAVPERVAGKVLEWSWKVGRGNRGGLSTVAFTRRQLCRVQVGEHLSSVSRGRKMLGLPPQDLVVPAAG